MLASALPFSDQSDTGDSVLALSIGLSIVPAPVHRLHLLLDLLQAEECLGVRPAMSVEGVHVILGNRLAGALVWADVPPPPVVNQVYVSKSECVSQSDFLEVFAACVATCSGASAGREPDSVRVKEKPCVRVIVGKVKRQNRT